MSSPKTGAEIRQSFINFFIQKGHTFVPSSSLVPGGDQTLLFTNAGMVQFKDVFLGTDKRPYTRAVNSQKCMRVAGKHNDLEDVGKDDTHHTFFEMLGNWSFGDYYKKEAIEWAWELLTGLWGLPKDKLWATAFKDDKGDIPTDEEAAQAWINRPGFVPSHLLYFGRKDNFWEMADTGPCGPNSEIHIDLGPDACDKQGQPGHVCRVNGDCTRFLELWNLVFMQYNRLGPNSLEPLPACHVDTGMGFDRIVSILEGVNSNYKTDLLEPVMDTIQRLSGDNDLTRQEHLTPYRVIADHGRAATFLIADGVVPGNTGRNYVCRMIIRRAARFGTKIGLTQPFLAEIAKVVIDVYGDAYPELVRNQKSILDYLTREEKQFTRTVEVGVSHLEDMLSELKSTGRTILDGGLAFDLYATYGLPLEITRDIAREGGLDVDEAGFRKAMEAHQNISGKGKAFGPLGGEDVDIYRTVLSELQAEGKLGLQGVTYDPYNSLEVEGSLLAMIREGESVDEAQPGDKVEVILPQTCFYVESGGQVADTGTIVSVAEPSWEIRVEDMRKPAAGIITHVGTVVAGHPRVDDTGIAAVDKQRRHSIMRNHTATHLLHAELHTVLGSHARQAGSLVAPDRLRFDFTHPDALTPEQLEGIEAGVNRAILENYPLTITIKPLQQAISEGAMALFGEKYGESVRTITIGQPETFSYELCGGTHVSETGDIGVFIITSEGSAAAGIRRIEAVTGWTAYELVQKRFQALKQVAARLGSGVDEVPTKVLSLQEDLESARHQVSTLRQRNTLAEFTQSLSKVQEIKGVPVLAVQLPDADADTLRQMADRFRAVHPSGVIVLGSSIEDRPIIIAAVTDDLVKRGLNAGELVRRVAQEIGGSGGGRPTLAQAGGKDISRLPQALQLVDDFVSQKLK
jgi:alanyl-tRNA synthetase